MQEVRLFKCNMTNDLKFYWTHLGVFFKKCHDAWFPSNYHQNSCSSQLSLYFFTMNLERGWWWNLLNHRYNLIFNIYISPTSLFTLWQSQRFWGKKILRLPGLNFDILDNVYSTEQITQCGHKASPAFKLKCIFSTDIQSPL